MASDVQISDDQLTWTFTIRDDAKWSNGDPVTAQDFEYSWKRLANPDTGAPYSYMLMVTQIKNAADVYYNGADVDTLGVKATDDHTLVVELSAPCSYLAGLLSKAMFAPINQSFCESQGDQFGLSIENTIFNGQYYLTDWEVGGNYLKLEKNPDYYAADEVTTDVLQYQVITDSAQMVMAWENGELDEVALTGENVELYKDDPAYKTAPGSFVMHLGFNMENEALSNINVRKAISLSIDKQAICDYIIKDGSVPLNFFVPEQFAQDENGVTFREAANATYLETDKAKAQEYWAKAKEELGFDTLELRLSYAEGSPKDLVCAEIQSELQDNLEGLTITLTTGPSKQVAEETLNGDFDITLKGWGADYEDATTFLDLYTSDNSYNAGHWSNERYDELYDLIYGEYASDPEKRLNALIEQESILLEDAAICPLYQTVTSFLLTTKYNFPYSVEGHGYMLQYATPAE
jgi:oligopeptide transport system substrate-binding protein